VSGAGAAHVLALQSSRRRGGTLVFICSACCRYRYGPQPKDFDGQRALDFVLDNNTLSDTNRTLLLDIKLLGAYPQR
jgi:hypothetical protein